MKRPTLGLMAAAMLWLALAQAQAPTPSSTQRITPNYQNVDIAVLADAVGQATGKTFTIDPRVRATMTLINPKPMTPQQLYQNFLSMLQVYGFAAVPAGNMVKIMPADAVRQMAPSGMSENSGPDEIVDAVIETKNLSAQQLNVVIRQLVPTAGTVLTVTGTNAMIINDRASNVVRIQRLVKQLDEAGAGGVEMRKLENSNATDVVRTLSTVTAGNPADAGGGAALRVIADDRTNSVLVSGDPGARARVLTLIDNLDKSVVDSDNTERRYLRYALADDVANVLKQQASASTSSGTGGAAAAPTVAAPAADRTVTILSDKATNLLIITAPPKTRKALMATVDAMDIERAQVIIEAIIADVSMDKSRDLGVNWAFFEQADGKVIPGGVFNSAVGSANSNPVDLATLATIVADPSSASVIPGGFTGAIGKLSKNGLSWAAMLRALSSDSDTNVLANPTLIALDNQEVTLQSGQQVPFITGQYTNTGNNNANNGSVNPFTTVQRQDVGTTLKITPRLNGKNAMTLTIDLDSSELAGQLGDAGSQITNKRTFHNVLLVQDQQWIVVGGLIRDSKISGETGVPLLSRIPLLGELFKVRNAKRQKTNLMVFIRPTILTDSAQASAATNAKYDLIRGEQVTQGQKFELLPLLPSDKPPLLPEAPPPAVTAPPATPQTSPVQ